MKKTQAINEQIRQNVLQEITDITATMETPEEIAFWECLAYQIRQFQTIDEARQLSDMIDYAIRNRETAAAIIENMRF